MRNFSSPKLSQGHAEYLKVIVVIALVVVVSSSFVFDYCIRFIFGVGLPWWVNIIAGLITIEISFPIAIVLWLLSVLTGLQGPLVR